MALGDCTQIPYRLTADEVSQISAAQSGNVAFVQFVNSGYPPTPPWGVVVSGGCGQILVTKMTNGQLAMVDITNYTWNGNNVGHTISSASYAPDAYQSPTGVFLSSLPQNVMDTINGGISGIENAVGSIVSTITSPFAPGGPLDFSQAGSWVTIALIGLGIVLAIRLSEN